MARRNKGQVIFGDVQDYRRLLETLGEACQKTGWRIHAYVLMVWVASSQNGEFKKSGFGLAETED
jgi:hypothetical protein